MKKETGKQSGFNYIMQLNAFWDRLEQESDLKQTSIVVYLALLHVNNRLKWKKRFKVVYDQMTTMAGIAKNTYYSALDELVKKGYIIWEKGPNQYQAATFEIKVLYQNSGEQKESAVPKFENALANATENALENAFANPVANIPKHINIETEKPINSEGAVVIDFPRDESFEGKVLGYFGFNQIANPDKYILVGQFCKCLANAGQIENFKLQFAAYCDYKKIKGYPHKLGNFLGNQSNLFQDGAWQDENWIKKLTDLKTDKPKQYGQQQQPLAPVREGAIERRNRLRKEQQG